ncbi:MAG: glycosyltransferase [Verrucomicrobiota bacterium]
MNHNGLDLEVDHELFALVKAGYEVDLFTRGKVDMEGVKSSRPLINWSRLYSNFSSKLYYNKIQHFFDWAASRRLKPGLYDVVVGWSGCAKKTFTQAKSLGIPTVLNAEIHHVDHNRVLHDMGLDCRRRREEYGVADRIVVHSAFCKKTFTDKGVEDESIYVAHRGVDLEKFSCLSRENNQVFRVVFFGRLCERKGIRQAISAWKLANLDHAEFWMIGAIDSSVKEDVESELSDRVKYIPFTSTPEQYLVQCDINLMPTESEGLAKSLVEAAACGLVTITTEESGFDLGEENGVFHVERDNIHRTAELMKHFYQERSLCKSLGLCARNSVEKSFTWEQFHQRFAQIVEESF